MSDPSYGTVIIDPPWDYRKPNRRKLDGSLSKQKGYAQQQYETITLADLALLPVGELVANVALVWTTGPMVPQAVHLIEAWGLSYVTMLYWVKTSPRGGPRLGPRGRITYMPHMGVGWWFRGNVEPVVVAKRPGSPSYRTKARSAFLSPVRGHSRKPVFLHTLAEAEFPGPYLELFATEQRAGWTCLGNQIDGLDIRQAISALQNNHKEDRKGD
jgi:N6-adenosine-specific RNA methylase IME4